MLSNPFQLHGKEPAKCIGRHDVLRDIEDAFDAEDPANVSIFGPKYIGKSVLLYEIAERHSRLASGALNPNSPFDGVVYWDIRHAGITNQDNFCKAFAKTLWPVLAGFNRDSAEVLKKNQTWAAIRLVAEDMADKDQKLLVVMDNFDALMRVNIPQGVWENIRNLHADKGSVYYLVGSREQLTELCSVNQEGYDLSDFPRIFPEDISVGPFTADDQDALRHSFGERSITFARGSDTEIDRLTGGVPPLTALLYRQLWDRTDSGGQIEHNDVQEAVNTLLQSEPHFNSTLKELWNDCSDKGKQALAALAHPKSRTKLRVNQGISYPAARQLINRGYVEEKGDQVVSSCRLMNEYAQQHGEAATAVNQLFGTREAYAEHMPGVISLRFAKVDETRLEQVKKGLYRKAEHIVEHTHEPAIMLGQVRLFCEDAVDACVKALCPEGKIPDQWTARWKSRGNPEKAMEGRVPSVTSSKLHLLHMATFSDYGLDVPLSRASYIALSYLKDAGNEGQHPSSELIPVFAHSISLAVISACDQLVRELTPEDAS